MTVLTTSPPRMNSSIGMLRASYRWATIGKEISHIEEATLGDVKDFFYGFYAPNNATLVVVGDVDPAEVYALAHKYFGSLPAESLAKPKIRSELPQTGTRRIEVKAVAQVPYLIMGYKTPP